MSVMQNILDAISQRIAAIVGGAVASRVETMAVLEQVHQQDALEERARQLEKEGKTELAESLRRRMFQTDHDNPGGQGQAVLARLRNETPAGRRAGTAGRRIAAIGCCSKTTKNGRRGGLRHSHNRRRRRAMNSNRKEQSEFVMRVLTRQVRAITLDQATRLVDSNGLQRASMRPLLDYLLDAGTVERSQMVVAYPRVQDRLLLWHKCRETPDHEKTRWQLSCRWSVVDPVSTQVYWATAKAERFYGGVAGMLNHTGQLEHDLGAAEVLTLAYEHKRKWASDWIGEDLLKREHPELVKQLQAMPDAVTLDAHGGIFKAIEFGGAVFRSPTQESARSVCPPVDPLRTLVNAY